jgi:hypothetical protein
MEPSIATPGDYRSQRRSKAVAGTPNIRAATLIAM